ncbi:MAG: EAL domain-containing protein [Gammaproteobacteria bacterium]|nr:EAL domain-containing protein [Gammaproteobacteria bacterium]
MTRDGNNGASNTDHANAKEAEISGITSEHKNEVPPGLQKNIKRSKNAVIDDKAEVQSREKLATAREDAAHIRESAATSREDSADLREDAAHLRESAVTSREDSADLREANLLEAQLLGVDAISREQEIHAAKMMETASSEQLTMLQEANANLVTATIEAYKLAEEVEATKKKLDHLAYHDVLTELPNRTLLQDRLNQAIEVAHRQGSRLALMFLDLDRFKHINDSLGHAVGDQLLQAVARRLMACVRHSDTVSRLGGDEFVLLLFTIACLEDAAVTAEKVLESLTRPYLIDRRDLHISASIGISIYPDDGQDAETLIKNADIAMYCAKENGRNNYKLFEQGMNALAVQRQSIEANLHRALERQEFVLHYQPKINLHSGAIVGVEALIRWNHPQRGLVLPAQFISIAEECGLILPIGRWVLREACRQAQAWQQAGLPPITVAVNTSALEFGAKDFFENVRATLDETQLAPCYLELELTESVLMRDAESTNALLQALADLGVKLAVDDFGTGYSSLSYLRQFPVDTLKIDQSFVSQMSGNVDDATIVTAVISLGKNLQKQVIAEGVETAEQCAFLLAQQCDEGQGYYFGYPEIAKTLTTLLQTGLPLPRSA